MTDASYVRPSELPMPSPANGTAAAERLSPAQLASIQQWIDAVRPMLHLSDWSIDVCPDFCEAQFDAQVARSDLEATIAIAPDFATYSADRQRLLLTHEMCHILLYWIDEHVDAGIASLATGPRRMFTNTYESVSEQTTHRLARIIAPYLPLPR